MSFKTARQEPRPTFALFASFAVKFRCRVPCPFVVENRGVVKFAGVKIGDFQPACRRKIRKCVLPIDTFVPARLSFFCRRRSLTNLLKKKMAEQRCGLLIVVHSVTALTKRLVRHWSPHESHLGSPRVDPVKGRVSRFFASLSQGMFRSTA